MSKNSINSYTFAARTMTGGIISLLTLAFSPTANALPCDFKNGDVFNSICAYTEAGTVQTGGQVNFHVSTSKPTFNVHIRRAGNTNAYIKTSTFTTGVKYSTSNTSYTGLGWGAGYNITIPSDWKSGIYEFSFNNGLESYSEFVAIKAAQPGTYSKILVLDSLPTVIAYSPIGGKSFYGFNSTDGLATSQLSMERPTGRGQWAEHREFVTWLDQKGIAYEAASMMDIQRDPSLLKNYNLVIMVGHNEYWSKEMRDAWDSYLAGGGNGAIFSGNTMWWQVRFSSDLKQIICYKSTTNDPAYSSDNTRVTTNWYKAPVNRPENTSIGVSFRHGGYHNYTEAGVPYYVKGSSTDNGSYGGFKVADINHWAFAGTGLADGAIFGRGNSDSGPIAGYEVDGALFKMVNGKPVATGEDGTPTNFHILAYTPAFATTTPSLIPGVVPNNYNGQGWGTMGIFKPTASSGTVFVAPTIDWSDGLNDPQVSHITENVINQLKSRGQQNMNSGSNGSSGSGTSTGSTSGTTSTPSTSSTSSNSNSGGGGGSLPVWAGLVGLLALRLRKRY